MQNLPEALPQPVRNLVIKTVFVMNAIVPTLGCHYGALNVTEDVSNISGPVLQIRFASDYVWATGKQQNCFVLVSSRNGSKL